MQKKIVCHNEKKKIINLEYKIPCNYYMLHSTHTVNDKNSMSSLIVCNSEHMRTLKYSSGTNLTKIWGQMKTNQPQWSPWRPPELHIFDVF